MIIITRHDVTDEELDHIRERVEAFGLQTHLSRGKHRTVVGCIGDEEVLAGVPLLSIPGVEAVHTVMQPYKLANLQFAAEPTRVPLGGINVGDTSVAVVAGPCSVEGIEMLSETAQRVQKAGAVGLRTAVRSSRVVHPTPSVGWAKMGSRYSPTSVPRPASRS